ncbi:MULTISPECIES: dihydroneopterin aldolase [Sulfurimonas]|uniref:Dihydroneopterin aldolase n=1 Tax=Sulfurimonas diazotrophicus TaxID=3131939 RepID=A0ABZ3H8B8_9BACT
MTIEIRALTFDCIIGILDFERVTPQRVIVDAVIDYDYEAGHFIDYAAVADHIRTQMRQEKFALVEEALEALSTTLKEAFPGIKSLSLTVAKPDILPDCRVSVTKKSNF